MHLTVHSTKFYDWMPVPDNAKVTDLDIKAERVKPAGGGGWLMKVTKAPEGGTFTMVTMPEGQIIAKIIHDKTRPEGGRTLTRAEALAFYLSENVMPQHAHRSWITKVEIHDDGPDENMIRAMLAPHTVAESARIGVCKDKGTHKYEKSTPADPSMCASCGHVEESDIATEPNIDPADVEAHVAAYMTPADATALVDHLHKYFKVKVS